MAIKGSLKEASLPDVLQLLALGKKTGCLAVADRQNFGYIYFDEGRISYASIVNRRDRIGDLLRKNQLVTSDQLDQAIRVQEVHRERRLGDILIELGIISRERLEQLLYLQIEEAVYHLFAWAQGTFNFEAGVKPEPQVFTVSINPESLLLEGARRVDEWSQIEKKIPSFDLIFAVDPGHVPGDDVDLSLAQRRILPLLDGTRDVRQVIDECSLIEFEAATALFGLITAGYARRVGTSSKVAAPTANDGRVQEHQNLGVAFYKTGMLDEAQREFRRVADLRPDEPGAHFFLGLIALKQARWLEAVEALQQAADRGGRRASALHNLGFAFEQLGRLSEAEAAYAEAASKAREDPRIMLGWGVAALKRNDPEVALGRLQRAAELWGERVIPATWYWAMALAVGGQGDLNGALAIAMEGTEKHPGVAALRNNLAVLQELAGDLPLAEVTLRAALAENPTLAQVSKNLGDLLYRAGRYDDAFEAYERAAKLAPSLGDDLFFKMGNIAFKRRDRDRARACWRRVTEINPGHQLARANLDTLETST
ncbi:MAG: tetratricopeptide repeat protein [Gemmatimonadetes bacterium]|nr:tetratricopeptide repeat protein [Gemmatimonadota bacterium]